MSIAESVLKTPDDPFFTNRLGGAGGVWLVSMNRLVLRLSGVCPLGGRGGASSTLDSDQELRNCCPSGGLLVLTAAEGLQGKDSGLLWER